MLYCLGGWVKCVFVRTTQHMDGEAKGDVRVSNYDDRDPISLESIADLLEGGEDGGGDVATFTVDMGGGKTHAYDADAWLTHLTTDNGEESRRRQGHVLTRAPLKPSEIWACFSAVVKLKSSSDHAEAGEEDKRDEEADPRIAKCLSVEIVGKRAVCSVDPVTRSRKHKVTLAPVSPLFNMRVKRMLKKGEGYTCDDEDENAPPMPTQCYEVAYDLVDSRDSERVVGPQREVQIMCPVGDLLSVI